MLVVTEVAGDAVETFGGHGFLAGIGEGDAPVFLVVAAVGFHIFVAFQMGNLWLADALKSLLHLHV